VYIPDVGFPDGWMAISGTSDNNDCFFPRAPRAESRFAYYAFFAFSAVDAMLQLKEAFFAIRVYVIGN